MIATALSAFTTCATDTIARTITFQPLLAESSADSTAASDVSDDGSVVVGSVNSGEFATKWTLPDTSIENLSGANAISGRALAASADGSVIVGEFTQADSTSLGRAFRWTQRDGQVELPPLIPDTAAIAFGVSGDGSIAVGMSVGEGGIYNAVVWSGLSTPRLLEGVPTDELSYASDVSHDGQVIVGTVGELAAVWEGAESPPILLELPGGTRFSHANDVSPDGKWVVGQSGVKGFLWSAETGLVDLGNWEGGQITDPRGVSADGQIIVGASLEIVGGTNEYEAIIMGPGRRWRTLEDFLNLHGQPTQWELHGATGVTADGRTIVGFGLNPQGLQQGWAITIPEPSSLSIVAMTAIVMSAAVRWRRIRSPTH